MTGIVLLLLSLVPALAAPAEGFVGTWMLDVSASDFGMMPAPDSGMTVFTRADDRLVMTRTVWTTMGPGYQTVEFDQATDGESGSASSSRGTEIPSRAWWEGDALMVEVEVQSNVGEILLTDRMSLTDDDTMLIERLLEVPGMDEMEHTIVYRRR